jgi:polyisoprenyl-teichoic acid--peptidoglycan teichoic acid transferase
VNRKILRALFYGNLLVYAVVAVLFVYYYGFPVESLTAASASGPEATSRPLISFILPTPTELAPQTLPPITPIALDTPIPLPTTSPAPNATPVPPTPTGAPPPTVVPVKDRGLIPPSALNILIMGTDRRSASQTNWRTDTLILVSVDQETKSVGLLSIPRDLWVNIPGIGANRINTADFYGEYYHLPGGGPATIKRTIEQNLGIRVHYYVRVGFDGFRKAVDTVGGIDVAVDCPLQEYNFSDDYGTVNLNFQPGLQHMDGVTALRYARSRETTNDFDRSRRQRQVLMALWDKATSLNLLPKWPELYSQFRDSVQTDLGPVELTALAWIGSQLQLDRIKSLAIDNHSTTPWVTPDGAMVLLPQPEKIHSLLVQFFSEPTNGPDPFELEKARVQVVSGSQQIANTATVALKRQGFDVTDPQITPALAPVSSIVVYHQEPATVQRLLSALRIDANNVQTAAKPAAPVDVQVILGRDYNACQR